MEKIKILIADDHPIFLQGLISLLSNEDNIEIVATASDGEKALKQCIKYNPDVAVIDVSMPELNGIECAKKIKKENLKTKVILLTMHKNSMILKSIKSPYISGVVLKDNTFEDLSYAIRSVFNGGKFIPPLLTEDIFKETDNAFNSLSEREKEILRLVVEGLSAKEIADKLYISSKTVETHKARIMKKLKVNKTSELIKKAMFFT